MTTATQTTDTTPAPAGHDAAMAARFDAAQTQTPETTTTTPERPAWLPEKFQSPEDLAKAYAALESKQGQQTQQTKPANEQQQTPPADEKSAAEALQQQGLDYSAFATEFAAKGELSTESYEKLAKAGVPKEVVDAYVEGQQALAANIQNDVFSTVGGAEKYAEIVGWAAKSLSPAEIDAFNATTDSGNTDAIKLAVAGLNAKFTAANGSEPNLLGGSTNAPAGTAFRSTSELTAAMSDPRYAKDPAYRNDVIAKLGRSNIL